MVVGWRRRVGRSITVVVAVLCLGIVVCCGNIGSARADSGEDRPGCGTYCQAAGPLAGGIGEGREAVTIHSSRTVVLDPDGYLPVTVTCNLSVQCRGVLSAGVAGLDFTARSDLLVNAGATATLGVGLPAAAVAHIRAQTPPCPSPTGSRDALGRPLFDCPERAGVLANVGPSFGCEIASHVGLPPCHWPIDGFTPLSSAELSVVAH
jgi:hypothetical protein